MPGFQHDGIRFNYRDEGAGMPFVFQHGLGADLTQPFSLCHPAPEGIRLIAFDARAHGQTTPVGPVERISLKTFADDLAALLDHLGIQRAIVGGISMGAAITLNFTLRFPKRVIGLVQSRPAWLDGPHPWNVAMFSLISRLIREHGPARGKQLFLETPEYRDTLDRWPDVATSLAASSATRPARIVASGRALPCRRCCSPTSAIPSTRSSSPWRCGRRFAGPSSGRSRPRP
jgi:pimeloyl-ACP methyl ester carboxylesterase